MTRTLLPFLLLVGCQDVGGADAFPHALSPVPFPHPIALSMEQETLVRGVDVTFVAAQATPGDRVYFVYGTHSPEATCLSAFGGRCADIANPVLLGSALADPAGEARLTLTVPSNVPIGATASFQAAVVQGAATYGSGVITETVRANFDLSVVWDFVPSQVAILIPFEVSASLVNHGPDPAEGVRVDAHIEDSNGIEVFGYSISGSGAVDVLPGTSVPLAPMNVSLWENSLAHASLDLVGVPAIAEFDRDRDPANDEARVAMTPLPRPVDGYVDQLTCDPVIQVGDSFFDVTTIALGNAGIVDSLFRMSTYYSRDDVWSPDDVRGLGDIELLRGGEVVTLTGSGSVPGDLLGPQHILVVVDPFDTVEEQDETNNIASCATTVFVAGADLRVTGPGNRFRGTYAPGDAIGPVVRVASPMGLEIGSWGTADADAGAAVEVWWSADDHYSSFEDILLATAPALPSIPSGTEYQVSPTGSVPLTLPLGPAYAIAIVDADRAVDEANEANNRLAIPIEIVAP